MKKYILGLFLVGFILAPWLSFATTAGDVDPNPQASDCVSIVNNLRYKDRDMNKNGEVSTLQDFLQSKNYLNNEPTGYFGILTVKAVKDFQKASGINPTGYVGQITRDKIVSITCEGGVHPNNPIIDGISGPQTLNVNQAGTWTVKASDPNGGSLSYSVNWGDQNAICRADSDCLRTTAIPQSQQLATFTHSYTRAGTFRPTFTIMSDNGIRCFTTPCSTGGSATTSTVVKVGNVVPVSSITVSSPNGGEVLTKGTNQIIKWQDNETFSCPVGAPCVQPLDRYYDISLFSYYPTCTGGDCHMIAMPYHAPQIIAQNVLGTSFNWQVGEVINNTGASDNIAANGSYIIQVCRTGTDLCDSSNSPFKINSSISNSNVPVISGISGPQTLNVNQTGTWKISAYDKSGESLSYSVNWGDVYPITATQSRDFQKSEKSQSATFTHSYSQAKIYTPIFTVTNSSGQSAKTSLSVNVGGTISNSNLTVISPNGGETLVKGNYQTINWQDNIRSTSMVQNYYDLKLVHYYAPCSNLSNCSLMPYLIPYTIAQNISGTSYNWKVGDVTSTGTSNNLALDGSYTIQVCKSGTEICDSSDSPFTVQ